MWIGYIATLYMDGTVVWFAWGSEDSERCPSTSEERSHSAIQTGQLLWPTLAYKRRHRWNTRGTRTVRRLALLGCLIVRWWPFYDRTSDSIHRRQSLLPFTIKTPPPFTYSRPLHDRAGYTKVSGENWKDDRYSRSTADVRRPFRLHHASSGFLPSFHTTHLLSQHCRTAQPQVITNTARHERGQLAEDRTNRLFVCIFCTCCKRERHKGNFVVRIKGDIRWQGWKGFRKYFDRYVASNNGIV